MNIPTMQTIYTVTYIDSDVQSFTLRTQREFNFYDDALNFFNNTNKNLKPRFFETTFEPHIEEIEMDNE